MRLEILEDGRGRDDDGNLYVRHGDHWRDADEPPADAPPLLLRNGPFGYRVPARDSQIVWTFGSDMLGVEIDGRRYHGALKILVEDTFGRRYLDTWAA